MQKPATSSSPWRGFWMLLWRQPLWAIPFALFFGTLYGKGWSGYRGGYVVSLIFAYMVGLFLWVAEYFVAPRLLTDSKLGAKSMVRHAAIFSGSAMLGAYAAAVLIHFTVVPGFLGSARAVLLNTVFILMFVVLVSGVIYAIHFYRDAVARVRAEEEMNLARRIQRSFLLSQFPTSPRLEVHAVNVSSKQVSGDFYDVVPDGDALLLAIADVAGKGVPAALLSSMLQASLRTQAGIASKVSAVLRNMNTLVYRSTSVNQFATFFLARVEERTMRLSYSNAGHNYPVLFRANGDRLTLERGGTVLGILEAGDFEEDDVPLLVGDRVLFYTDGISEAPDPRGELFGEERLYRLMQGLPPDLSARQITERILDGVHQFQAGREPDDDMTVMALRVT